LVVSNTATNVGPVVVGDHSGSPNFHYNYGVSDPVTGDQKSHTETREGDVVRGKYSFVDSDGSIRTVTYTADALHGFQVRLNTKKTKKCSHRDDAEMILLILGNFHE
jgi:hypothetical protein